MKLPKWSGVNIKSLYSVGPANWGLSVCVFCSIRALTLHPLSLACSVGRSEAKQFCFLFFNPVNIGMLLVSKISNSESVQEVLLGAMTTHLEVVF